MYRQQPVREPCPNCGAPKGAIMGSSNWGHNITCCGDKCGLEIRDKLESNLSSVRYRALDKLYYWIRGMRADAKHRGINAIDFDPYMDGY